MYSTDTHPPSSSLAPCALPCTACCCKLQSINKVTSRFFLSLPPARNNTRARNVNVQIMWLIFFVFGCYNIEYYHKIILSIIVTFDRPIACGFGNHSISILFRIQRLSFFTHFPSFSLFFNLFFFSIFFSPYCLHCGCGASHFPSSSLPHHLPLSPLGLGLRPPPSGVTASVDRRCGVLLLLLLRFLHFGVQREKRQCM